MKGPYDNSLSWPLSDKFEMKLLNQISDSQHRSVAVNYDDVSDLQDYSGRVIVGDKAEGGYGEPKLISHEDLHKITSTCQYLKDDCLYLQIIKHYDDEHE